MVGHAAARFEMAPMAGWMKRLLVAMAASSSHFSISFQNEKPGRTCITPMLLGLRSLSSHTGPLHAPLPTSKTRARAFDWAVTSQCIGGQSMRIRKGKSRRDMGSIQRQVRGPTREITDAAPMAPIPSLGSFVVRMPWECWLTNPPSSFFFFFAWVGMVVASL